MTAALEVRELAVRYGAYRAVDHVDLTIPAGSVVALLGPNGAGKSSILRAISGLTIPESGTITLDGRRIDGLTPDRIARLGVCHIPEERGIFPQLTVAENVAVAAGSARSGARERVAAAFPDLGVRMGQRASTLSGGQQQMLALARAIVTDAPVLLLDELSLGLAPILVDALYGQITRFRDEGRTIVLVEQYVPRALALAEIVYVLARGRVVFAGEPGELRHAGTLAASYLGAL